MKHVSRRVTVGVLSATVVATMVGVSTWAMAGESPSAAPVRLVVGLKLGADTAAPMRTVSAMGARSIDATGPAQQAMSVLSAKTLEVSGARSAKVIAALKSDPNVSYVEVDQVRKAFIAPNDPLYTEYHEVDNKNIRMQVEVDQVKLPAAWDTTTGDAAVKIAVVDTGVSKKNDLEGAVLGGYNYVSNNGNTDDDFVTPDRDHEVERTSVRIGQPVLLDVPPLDLVAFTLQTFDERVRPRALVPGVRILVDEDAHAHAPTRDVPELGRVCQRYRPQRSFDEDVSR